MKEMKKRNERRNEWNEEPNGDEWKIDGSEIGRNLK